jgi:DNA-binding FrmR family transcriptional regulator
MPDDVSATRAKLEEVRAMLAAAPDDRALQDRFRRLSGALAAIEECIERRRLLVACRRAIAARFN